MVSQPLLDELTVILTIHAGRVPGRSVREFWQGLNRSVQPGILDAYPEKKSRTLARTICRNDRVSGFVGIHANPRVRCTQTVVFDVWRSGGSKAKGD